MNKYKLGMSSQSGWMKEKRVKVAEGGYVVIIVEGSCAIDQPWAGTTT